MLISAEHKEEVEEIKAGLSSEFDMKDLGEAKRILGMDIVRDRNAKKIWLTQRDYVQKVLKKFQMDNNKSVSVPLDNNSN